MISAGDLRDYVGQVESTDTEANAILADLESRAVALVQRATGRFYGASGSYTYYLTGTGQESVFVPDEITAVSAVYYRSTLAEDWTELTSDNYERVESQFFRTDGLLWPEGRNLVKITATRGYATDAEPGPIRQLVLDLVAWQYRVGRKLSLDDSGSPDVRNVEGWERTISMYRRPLYG